MMQHMPNVALGSGAVDTVQRCPQAFSQLKLCRCLEKEHGQRQFGRGMHFVSLVAKPLAVDLLGESDFLGTPGETRKGAQA